MKPELKNSYEDYYNRKVSYLDKLRDDHRLKCVLEEDEIDEYRDSVLNLFECWWFYSPELIELNKSQLFEDSLFQVDTILWKLERGGNCCERFECLIDDDLYLFKVLKQSFNFYWDTYMGWYEEELSEEVRGVINRERENFFL